MLRTSLALIALGLTWWGCGNADEISSGDPNASNTLGDPTANGNPATGSDQDGGAVGFLIDTLQPAAEHCTVTFINPTFALTAAHCLQRGVSASRYQVSAYSPVRQPLRGTPVQQLYLHPSWTGDTSLVTSHLGAISSGNTQSPTLESNPLYDIAVIQLVASPPGALMIPSGPLPVLNDRIPFTSKLFSRGTNDERRITENLVATDVRPSSFSSLLPMSQTQLSLGGAAAVISAGGVTGSSEVIVGIFAGGAPNLGAVFTRIDVHRAFINDAISGVLTGNYTVDHDALRDPNNPNPNPNPGSFDCAQTSDNFCDYGCDGDVDCEMSTPVKLSTFGTPCTSGAECTSGVCLEFDEVNIRCSAYCRGAPGDCPDGFVCREAVSGNLVCGTPLDAGGNLPPPPALKYFGADCSSDAECSTNACITYMGASWCSERCTQNSDCPLSYVCGMVTGGMGCVPPNNPPPPTPPEGNTTPPEGGSAPPEGNTTPPEGGSAPPEGG